jgi:small subunit ribosomal protein S6
MFLLDAGNPDFQAASEPARTLLERNSTEIMALKLWDERKLAYDVSGRRRGLYVLGYFKARTEQIPTLEHDCLLDERILRMLVLKHDNGVKQEVIDAQTPAQTGRRDERREDEYEGRDHRPRRRREEEEGFVADEIPSAIVDLDEKE